MSNSLDPDQALCFVEPDLVLNCLQKLSVDDTRKQKVKNVENVFSYFSIKTYFVDTQKNRLNETVLLSAQNTCLNLWIKKYLQFLA